MKRFILILIVFALAVSVAGCGRTKRIANDVNWIVFDGEPSKDN